VKFGTAALLALLLLFSGFDPVSGAQKEGTKTTEAKTAEAKAYDILLKRPSRVGERFEFEAEATLLQEESFFNENQMFDGSHSTAEVKFEAVGTVLEVDGAGGVTRSEYVVKSFFGKLRGEEIRPVAAGEVVFAATTEQGTQLSLKEGDLTPPQKVLLAQIIETASPGAPSDDDLFGSMEAHPVGGSWAVNGLNIADAFLRGGLVIPLDEIQGSSKVESLGEVGGVGCLHISGSVEAANVFPADIQPEELENSLLKLSFEGDYPLDPAIQALRGKIETLFEVTIVFDDGLPKEPGGPAGERLSTKQLTETVKSFQVRPLPARPQPGRSLPASESTGNDAG